MTLRTRAVLSTLGALALVSLLALAMAASAQNKVSLDAPATLPADI